ncbi:AAA domain-containing protein [Paenibacillus sp. UNCCL117]|uniref:AAA family ATPase n=1 Tax=unclassified Paenibacillus TaxID=185978 RepID=UPI0008837547|nr:MULTISPECIES: AAA family ATPase [unclassified Paenibacillus]SDE61967.1 AAA domain-containing protein [Paenibacillus sp. cl123]SFW69852.1 AAA domain-containing protein [Paenibacillus sp. UNCCL117]
MIIWINGAFGAGKTQTAYELHRRMPGSVVYDPEEAGYFIRRQIPRQIAKDDFQLYPMWREINYAMLAYLNREYPGAVIVPMTVVDPAIFDEIVGRLRRDGMEVRHFALCASRAALLRRLRSRGEGSGSWAAQQIDRCLTGLADEAFERRLDTEHWSVRQTAEAIAAELGIMLTPDNRSGARKLWDRLRTQIGHIRWLGGMK